MIGIFLFLLCFSSLCSSSTLGSDESDIMNEVFPPFGIKHGPHRSHRHVRECQPVKYGNTTHESYPSHISEDKDSDVMELRYFSKELQDSFPLQLLFGHQVIVNDPVLTLSVLEPGTIGGCTSKTRESVSNSANQKHCLFAVNAGFFNVTDGACLGNVVSDGREAFNSGGIQNVHFGIKKDKSLFTGYIPENEALNDTFEQLVGGVIWLVRNGENYIETSKIAECPDAQTTGSLQKFIDVLSARTAIGHDQLGRVHIVQVDGKTLKRGVPLNEFANFLLSLGLVNAINLDGGGSATAVLNGSVINYPSDTKVTDNFTYNVARKVSTIVCVSDRKCIPDCGLNGHCVRGICECGENWHGVRCEDLLCPGRNCSKNGDCTTGGCVCFPGYDGEDCSRKCHEGTYGFGCRGICRCPGNATTCDFITGRCVCSAGYFGQSCESICPLGHFGEECAGVCRCENSCFCDPIDGSCEPRTPSAFFQAGHCYGNLSVIVQTGVSLVSSSELRLWLYAAVAVAVVSLFSLTLNSIFLCRYCGRRRRKKSLPKKQRQHPRHTMFHSDDDDDNDIFGDGKEDAEIPLMNLDGNILPRPAR